MADIVQGVINGIFAGIGFFIVEIYIKPYMEKIKMQKLINKLNNKEMK